MVYGPFLYRLKGDHRAFYFDIREDDLFGNEQEGASEFEKLGLKSRDRKNVVIYLKSLHKYLVDNTVLERLQQAVETGTSPTIIKEVDELITGGCMNAEKKCRKRPQVAWNVEIHKLKQEITVWSIFKNRKKKNE